MPARPSEPRLGARPEAGASGARTHAGWGRGGSRLSPAPGARALVRRSARPLPATAPPFFRASSPPRAASGPRSPARSLALWSARSVARQSARRALGGGPTTQQQEQLEEEQQPH